MTVVSTADHEREYLTVADVAAELVVIRCVPIDHDGPAYCFERRAYSRSPAASRASFLSPKARHQTHFPSRIRTAIQINMSIGVPLPAP